MSQNYLVDQGKMAHQNVTKRLYIYTDAPSTFCSDINTQVSQSALALDHVDKHHEPAGFLSIQLNTIQLEWSTLEKESHAVMATVDCIHWLAATVNEFEFYTNQNSLVFIFNPLSVVLNILQTIFGIVNC